MKKNRGKELLVFGFSMAALICAVVSLNDSLNLLVEKEEAAKEAK